MTCEMCEDPIMPFVVPLCGCCARRFLQAYMALAPVRNPDHPEGLAQQAPRYNGRSTHYKPRTTLASLPPDQAPDPATERVAWLQWRLRQVAANRHKPS